MQPYVEHALKDRQHGQPVHPTFLNRTQLATEEKVELAGQALGREREHGAKTELAREFGVSRPTVYAAQATAAQVRTKHFDEEASNTTWVRVNKAQIRRAVVALRVMAPNSLRPIKALLPILYPGVTMSYGTVQKIAVEAGQRAAKHNAACDLSKIEAGALDEMYSQGQPVLAGVDLDSGYLFTLELREHRGADDWADLLRTGQRQGLDLKTVVKDAAPGIAAGVRAVFPDAEQRDDCFHAHYEMGKVRRIVEARATGGRSHRKKRRKRSSPSVVGPEKENHARFLSRGFARPRAGAEMQLSCTTLFRGRCARFRRRWSLWTSNVVNCARPKMHKPRLSEPQQR
ncbi:MAG: hypothetical protein V3V08_00315 [Nannocystaceae bacterium]